MRSADPATLVLIAFVNGIWFGLIAAAAAASLGALYFTERQRQNSVRTMALRLGFHFLGSALPRTLALQGTSLERISQVWNVIDGEPRGVRITAFDCQVGIGRHSWRRSVIAIESEVALSEIIVFHHEMEVESVGGWKFLYRPKASSKFRFSGLMPVE